MDMEVKMWGIDEAAKKEIREHISSYPDDPDRTLDAMRKDFLRFLPESLKKDFLVMESYANIVQGFHEYEAFQCGYRRGKEERVPENQ